jgi:O-antigen/teichoic acid export membrane protein
MLSTKTILGAGWLISSRLGGRVIDVVTVLVLARTLTPADFGLTALAMTLIAVVDTVLEIPLIQALIRLKYVEKSHLDTAFTLGVLRGLLLSLVVLGAAWPFSIIFHDGRLIALVAVLAIGPMSRSLYSPRMVKFIREMSFRQAFIAEFMGKILASATAIVVVYLGGGYWAIAASSVVSSLANTLFSYLLAPYRPALSLFNISDFSTFLGWFSAAQVVSALSWQFDRVLLGYFVTKSELGQYTMATDLAVLPTQSLIGPAMQPVMAAFSRINDDRARLRNAYLKASRFTMLLAVPACVGMSLTSDLIIHALLGGSKWKEAAIYLQWLALATVLNAYYQPLYSLALAINRPSVIFRLSIIELCFRIILISSGLYFYSVMGVVAARGALSIIMFLAALVTARSLTGINMATEVGNLWRVGVSCSVMALLVVLLRNELAGTGLNAVMELGLTAALGGLVYAGTLFALGVRLRAISSLVD